MALRPWLHQPRTSDLHSVKLVARGSWPQRLVSFSSAGWHSFTRVGAPWPAGAGWAARTRTIDRPQWVDVPKIYGLRGGPAFTQIPQARAQFRKGQPAKRTYALAQALRHSAESIRSKRG